MVVVGFFIFFFYLFLFLFISPPSSFRCIVWDGACLFVVGTNLVSYAFTLVLVRLIRFGAMFCDVLLNGQGVLSKCLGLYEWSSVPLLRSLVHRPPFRYSVGLYLFRLVYRRLP